MDRIYVITSRSDSHRAERSILFRFDDAVNVFTLADLWLCRLLNHITHENTPRREVLWKSRCVRRDFRILGGPLAGVNASQIQAVRGFPSCRILPALTSTVGKNATVAVEVRLHAGFGNCALGLI